jgi:hypothetical protein
MHLLFDFGVAHSFIAHRLVGKLRKKYSCRVENRFTISTLLRENVCVVHMYKRVRVDIIGSEIRMDLLPLELCDFDVILGMDWLSTYRA